MLTSPNASLQPDAQLRIFLPISLSALILTGILYLIDHTAYSRFFGGINPIVVVTFTIIVGALCLRWLRSIAGVQIYRTAGKTRALIIVGIPLLLFCGILWVDTRGVFPEDLNVAFPESLLFYPSIAYVVEIVFHAVPLTLCVSLFSSVFTQWKQPTVLLVAVPLVALLEPIFQIVTFGANYPLWAGIYIAANIFVINLVQLWLFTKYDFVSMLAFRVVYYVAWHIVWGALRIRLLFS